MAIPASAALREEIHYLSNDSRLVITDQRWYDPHAPDDRPRSWVRLIRNGRVCRDQQVTGPRRHRELEMFWADRVAEAAPTRLDEAQMWTKLGEVAGIRQTECQRKYCHSKMPVGWWICAVCGADARRVARGSLSGVRRHGDIVLPVRTPGGTETP